MRKSKFIALAVTACVTATLFTGCSLKKEAKDVNIGINYEISGAVSSYGESSLEGAQLALENQNKNGGLLDKKIKIFAMDNKSDNQEAASVAKKLVAKKDVIAMIGPATSGGVKTAREVAEKNKVPIISGSSTAEDATTDASGKVMDYVFRTCFNDAFQGKAMAEYAYKNLKLRKIVMLIDSSSDYSKGLGKYFKETFEKNGGKILAQESFVSSDNDYKAVLTKVKGEKPDGVYLPSYYKEVGMMLQQARGLGLNIPFLGGDGYESPDLAKLAGGAKNLEKVYYTNHYASDRKNEAVDKFKKDFSKKYGKEPTVFSALAYDTAGLLCQAIKNADSIDGAKIKDALAKIKNYKGVTGTISIDSKHSAKKPIFVLKLENGVPKYDTTINP